MNRVKLLTVSIILVMAAISVGPRLMTAQAAPPANDDFYNAVVISALPFAHSTDTREATIGPNDPELCGYQAYNTVWFSYTSPVDGRIQISTEDSSYLTASGVYTGDYNIGLNQVACDETRAGALVVEVSAGTTYFIMVADLPDSYPPYPIGYYGGDLELRVDAVDLPVNDDFDNARLISGLPYTDSMDTFLATSALDDPTDCVAIKSVWYVFTPSADLLIEANTFGSDFDTMLAVYTGMRGSLSLVEGACNDDFDGRNSRLSFHVTANTTYYFMVGSYSGAYGEDGGNLVFNVQGNIAPANDLFADAQVVTGIPFSATVNIEHASIEPGEPQPTCYSSVLEHTIWYSYTPSAAESVTFQRSGFENSFIATYTGSSRDQLTQLECATYPDGLFSLHLDTGVTYYIQIGTHYYQDSFDITLDLYFPSPPQVDFWWSPDDPNRFETLQFCDSSSDPGGQGFSNLWWDFGDGIVQEGSESCVDHQFAVDGDYTVWHKAQTEDGRRAEVSKPVSVRTHDVGIAMVRAPQAASVDQTRLIIVGISNKNYPENVTVDLFKILDDGFDWVGTVKQPAPVLPFNRTTNFRFIYTFTDLDGEFGSVRFEAIATINGARDAWEPDNYHISSPVKVRAIK